PITASMLSFLFFSLIRPRPPPPTLFPYTTLFRSTALEEKITAHRGLFNEDVNAFNIRIASVPDTFVAGMMHLQPHPLKKVSGTRSEEHTSELQSRENLVCRLLLEKKNNTTSK